MERKLYTRLAPLGTTSSLAYGYPVDLLDSIPLQQDSLSCLKLEFGCSDPTDHFLDSAVHWTVLAVRPLLSAVRPLDRVGLPHMQQQTSLATRELSARHSQLLDGA